jgi:hypothetical protein
MHLKPQQLSELACQNRKVFAHMYMQAGRPDEIVKKSPKNAAQPIFVNVIYVIYA